MACSAGVPREVVDDDIDLGGGFAERGVGRGGVSVEGDEGVGAEGGERVEAFEIAACADDVACAEALGDLHGHLASVAGGAENEHALPRGERTASAQGDPGGHGWVHGGGDGGDVHASREEDGAAEIDHGLLGHRPSSGVGDDEVDEAAIGNATEPHLCRG